MEMSWKLMRVEVLLILLAAVAKTPASAAGSMSLPGCRDRCGNVSVPYPFGIDAGCFRDVGFRLSCDDAVSPPKLFVDDKEVVDVSLSGRLRAKAEMAVDCYDRNGVHLTNGLQFVIFARGRPFTVSHTMNKFTAVGCDTTAVFGELNGQDFTAGCMSFCGGGLDDISNGTCVGMGCCQVPIPRGLRNYLSRLGSTEKYNLSSQSSRCGYSFIVEESQYKFSTADLQNSKFNENRFPVVVDWSIGNQTCQQVLSNKPADYACRSEHSSCADSDNGVGYICNCTEGYAGNPYLEQGCQDIDECADEARYPCKGICTNTPGSYTCLCPEGLSSPDPTRERCVSRDGTIPLAAKLGIGFGAAFLVLLVCGSWIYLGFHKRKLLQLKQKFFQQNGGLFLQQHISAHQGAMAFKIFTEEELAKATGNFDKSQILGEGGYGTVYKGTLDDGREVAIKRSKTVDEKQSKEFATEMLILSQINHKNIVKLVGCCLEVEVPMLVYEFVSNGTLYHWVHGTGPGNGATSSLEARIRIASEAAEALAYLHCYASPPIIHGDVKPHNILLDECYMSKVSDFGASTLAPLDTEQFATMVQGTFGYLDPEALVTWRLTEKSDVYSFGVVLAELITGKKALCVDGGVDVRNKGLANCFMSAFNEERVAQIFEAQLVKTISREQMGVLEEVAKLTHHCLQMKGDERPTMTEVARRLQELAEKAARTRPWAPNSGLEAEAERPLREEPPVGGNYVHIAEDGHTEYLSIISHDTLDIRYARR